MRDAPSPNATSLKQPFSSWSTAHTGLLGQGMEREGEEVEPFRKAPAPRAFHASDILSQLTPDPLLAITPEKNLGLATLQRSRPQFKDAVALGDPAPKGRQRVRFAPDTVTSPPARKTVGQGVGTDATNVAQDGDTGGTKSHDDDCEPRSFSVVSQQLYEPGRYAGCDDGSDGMDSVQESTRVSAVKERGKKETQVCVPLTKTAGGRESKGRTVEGRVVRHTPHTASDAEVSEVTQRAVQSNATRAGTASTGRRSRSPCGSSASSSPVRGRSSRPVSPGQRSRSPSKSPGRLTPVECSILTDDDTLTAQVKVIREVAPPPGVNDYLFPFQEGLVRGHDSGVENPLARPEFNSALKISEELRSVRSRRPDTWQVVTQQLNANQQKRSNIQEKASSKVNVQRQSETYCGLVEVDAPLDDMCHTLERGLTLRAPPSKPAPSRVPVGKEPDLMEFFPLTLQAELPDLTLTGMAAVTDSLTTANPALALDLYRHNRAWSGVTDS